MKKEIITVNMGEYRVSKNPNMFKTILGSCVGVIIYDKVNKIGGLAHVYLPRSMDYKKNPKKNNYNLKYADILIPHMIRELVRNNGQKRYFISYIIGGATLFNVKPNSVIDIGRKNLEIVREILRTEKITFFELHVGGKTGRKVIFNLSNGDISIKNLSKTTGII